MNIHHVLLHLSLIEGVGPATIKTICARKSTHSEWSDLYDFSHSDWQQLGCTTKMAALLVHGLQDKVALEKELALMQKHAIYFVSILDDAYPERLKAIHAPPPILFYQGDISCTKAVAIVGSRDAHAYGERVINEIVPQLVQHDYTIVSGGALGADAMAHEATLGARGKTIVVLGSGLMHLAPRTHTKLFERIKADGGAIMSSFAANTTAQPNNFPVRNRVIAGLSQGVLVVQAAARSGAAITARYALDEGRDVFAIPGSIDDPLSAGCHALIQQGAKLVTCAADILEEYEAKVYDKKVAKKEIGAYANGQLSIKNIKNPLHCKIITACRTAQSIDELAELLDLALVEVQKELFALHLKGLIEQDFMGLWRIK